MSDANTEGLDISIKDGVAVLTLNRPSIRNGCTNDDAWEYAKFFKSATTDPAVRAIVVAGSGKDFCTGGAAGPNPPPPMRTTIDYRFTSTPHIEMFRAMWETEKPVGQRRQRHGGRRGLAARPARRPRRRRQGELAGTHVFTRIGMIPHAGDSFYLPRIIPFHRLNEIALLSDAITADTLNDWGLINRLVEKEDVLTTAMELATRLAQGPTRSLGLTKRHYRRSLEADWNTMLREEMAGQALNSITADRQEANKAAAEKRPPKFTGD
jgi:2-(1,2-epoxy-1,2-dihydrophenyl)acetyl-CoA isomerase